VQANANYSALLQGTVRPEDAARYRDQGKVKQTVGSALMGAGAAGLVAAGAMWLFGGGGEGPQVSVQPGPGQLSVGISGPLP
jgi:hypothetical protein